MHSLLKIVESFFSSICEPSLVSNLKPCYGPSFLVNSSVQEPILPIVEMGEGCFNGIRRPSLAIRLLANLWALPYSASWRQVEPMGWSEINLMQSPYPILRLWNDFTIASCLADDIPICQSTRATHKRRIEARFGTISLLPSKVVLAVGRVFTTNQAFGNLIVLLSLLRLIWFWGCADL